LRTWRREAFGDTGRVACAGAAGAGLLVAGLHAQAAAGAFMVVVVVVEVFESLIV
jgi:hypothetical protein